MQGAPYAFDRQGCSITAPVNVAVEASHQGHQAHNRWGQVWNLARPGSKDLSRLHPASQVFPTAVLCLPRAVLVEPTRASTKSECSPLTHKIESDRGSSPAVFPLPSPFGREPSTHDAVVTGAASQPVQGSGTRGTASSRRPRPAPGLSLSVRRRVGARVSDLRRAGPRGDPGARGARGPTHPPHRGPPRRCRPRGPHSWTGSAQLSPGLDTHLTAAGPSPGSPAVGVRRPLPPQPAPGQSLPF